MNPAQCANLCFAVSFTLALGSKNLLTKETTCHTQQFQYLIEDYLTYFQYAVIKRREIETVEKSNSTYIIKLG